MLTYKQRYKPRTTREYTKSDLKVYDSAGNTALNALTVYGKSEVVDGVIKSAGEGWNTVDLGTLTWEYITNVDPAWAIFRAQVPNIVIPSQSLDRIKGLLCPLYPIATQTSFSSMENNTMLRYNGSIVIKDNAFTDATAFKNSLNGVLLCYQLADPTQGNTIAVKTDNGTGIDGTMAVFETGTPLYGVDENTRDAMNWSGSASEITKKCSKIRLTDLTWTYNTNRQYFHANLSVAAINNDDKINGICSIYTADTINNVYRMISENKTIGVSGGRTFIKDTDYTTVEDFVASLGDAELVYELATPTVTPLTQAENESIAGLRTFDGTTHFTNNATTDMTVNYTMRVPTIS